MHRSLLFCPLLLALALVLPSSVQAEEEGDVLLDGIPEVPAEVVARLTQYQGTRWASMRDIDVTGSKLLVTTRLGEIGQVHLVDHPGGARQQITFRSEGAKNPEFVPGSDRSFLFRSDIGGDEQHQIFRYDLDTGTTTLLTTAGFRHGGWSWSPSGKSIAYTSNERNGKDFDVWLGDGRTAEAARLLTEGEGYYGVAGWSPDSSKLLVHEYRSVSDARVHIVDAQTGESKRLVGGSRRDTASYSWPIFGRSSDEVFMTSDRDGEFVQLYRVTRSGRRWKWEPLTADIPWNVGDLALSADRSQMAFTVNEGGWSALYLMDVASGERTRVESLPKGIVYGLDYAGSAPLLGLTMAGPTRTGDAWTLNTQTQELQQWTHSEMGGLDPEGFIAPTLIEFESFDGLKVPAFYYRPEGEGPFPSVIDIHGGPEGQAKPYFSARTQYLLKELGIAVIVPNVRGSAGYGKSYLALDNGRLREDSVKDIGALLDWIEANEELDASRVAVSGGSYGGYMVLASLVHFADRLVAGIDVVGISNFVTFLENTKEYRQDVRRVEYGDERDPAMREFLESISPLNHVDRITSALLVGQGANDPRVPASEAEQIVEAVRGQGRDVWYMLARNEGHGFRRKSNRDLWVQVSTMFLEKHLLGEAAEEPAAPAEESSEAAPAESPAGE